MVEIALFQPEIPPNTGNIMRLAANTGCRLHLIEPLGFRLTDRTLARAGMDYRDGVEIARHSGWEAFQEWSGGRRILALTTQGATRYDLMRYAAGDILLFGAETRGLPPSILDTIRSEFRLRLPMQPGSRSLNLANAVAIVVYEAWRQRGFAGGK